MATGAELLLPDLFLPGSDYLAVISEEAYSHVVRALTERFGGELDERLLSSAREGTAPLLSNFESFYLEEENLLVLIPPYQAAPYAAGDFQVTIPREILLPFLREQYY